tara:strand:- start:24 stop:443 length:420 start_codon:yes stop_codon:yes gene_type:complete
VALGLWLILSVIGVAFTQWQKHYYTNELADTAPEELYVKEAYCHRNSGSVRLRRKKDYAEYFVNDISREKCSSLRQGDLVLLTYDHYLDEYIFPEAFGVQRKEVGFAFLSLGLCMLCCGYQVVKYKLGYTFTAPGAKKR